MPFLQAAVPADTDKERDNVHGEAPIDICIREKGRGMYSPLPFISFYYSFAEPFIPLCSCNGHGWDEAIEF